jgi:hypothetical protein
MPGNTRLGGNMKLIIKIFMFIVLGGFFLFSMPVFLLIALGSTLILYGKGNEPFMTIAKETFGEVSEYFNPIRIVFKKD